MDSKENPQNSKGRFSLFGGSKKVRPAETGTRPKSTNPLYQTEGAAALPPADQPYGRQTASVPRNATARFSSGLSEVRGQNVQPTARKVDPVPKDQSDQSAKLIKERDQLLAENARLQMQNAKLQQQNLDLTKGDKGVETSYETASETEPITSESESETLQNSVLEAPVSAAKNSAPKSPKSRKQWAEENAHKFYHYGDRVFTSTPRESDDEAERDYEEEVDAAKSVEFSKSSKSLDSSIIRVKTKKHKEILLDRKDQALNLNELRPIIKNIEVDEKKLREPEYYPGHTWRDIHEQIEIKKSVKLLVPQMKGLLHMVAELRYMMKQGCSILQATEQYQVIKQAYNQLHDEEDLLIEYLRNHAQFSEDEINELIDKMSASYNYAPEIIDELKIEYLDYLNNAPTRPNKKQSVPSPRAQKRDKVLPKKSAIKPEIEPIPMPLNQPISNPHVPPLPIHQNQNIPINHNQPPALGMIPQLNPMSMPAHYSAPTNPFLPGHTPYPTTQPPTLYDPGMFQRILPRNINIKNLPENATPIQCRNFCYSFKVAVQRFAMTPGEQLLNLATFVDDDDLATEISECPLTEEGLAQAFEAINEQYGGEDSIKMDYQQRIKKLKKPLNTIPEIRRLINILRNIFNDVAAQGCFSEIKSLYFNEIYDKLATDLQRDYVNGGYEFNLNALHRYMQIVLKHKRYLRQLSNTYDQPKPKSSAPSSSRPNYSSRNNSRRFVKNNNYAVDAQPAQNAKTSFPDVSKVNVPKKCIVCLKMKKPESKADHPVMECPNFKALGSASARIKFITENDLYLCRVCLKRHDGPCRSGQCCSYPQCPRQRNHCTLLCLKQEEDSPNQNNQNNRSQNRRGGNNRKQGKPDNANINYLKNSDDDSATNTDDEDNENDQLPLATNATVQNGNDLLPTKYSAYLPVVEIVNPETKESIRGLAHIDMGSNESWLQIKAAKQINLPSLGKGPVNCTTINGETLYEDTDICEFILRTQNGFSSLMRCRAMKEMPKCKFVRPEFIKNNFPYLKTIPFETVTPEEANVLINIGRDFRKLGHVRDEVEGPEPDTPVALEFDLGWCLSVPEFMLDGHESGYESDCFVTI